MKNLNDFKLFVEDAKYSDLTTNEQYLHDLMKIRQNIYGCENAKHVEVSENMIKAWFKKWENSKEIKSVDKDKKSLEDLISVARKKYDDLVSEKKITIKQNDKFISEVEKVLNNYPQVEPQFNMDKTAIETKLGVLNIARYDAKGHEIYSIFMRFSDPERAKDVVDCNPHSGKWNIHYNSLNGVIMELTDRLESIKIDGLNEAIYSAF